MDKKNKLLRTLLELYELSIFTSFLDKIIGMIIALIVFSIFRLFVISNIDNFNSYVKSLNMVLVGYIPAMIAVGYYKENHNLGTRLKFYGFNVKDVLKFNVDQFFSFNWVHYVFLTGFGILADFMLIFITKNRIMMCTTFCITVLLLILPIINNIVTFFAVKEINLNLWKKGLYMTIYFVTTYVIMMFAFASANPLVMNDYYLYLPDIWLFLLFLGLSVGHWYIFTKIIESRIEWQ